MTAMDYININVTGDIFLGGRIESLTKENAASVFDHGLVDLFVKSQLNIVNLEGCLTDAGNEHCIIKNGPHIKAAPHTIELLKVLKINLATLANNHIYDFGSKGLADTLNTCAAHNISTVGAGLSLGDASKIFIKKIGDIKIGVLNIAENEEGVANKSHGGANPMDVIANTRALHEAKKLADIVILIVHGGHELYHYPSPRMVDQYHYYAEEGASVIINHHSHCISGYEMCGKVPVFYGLGNFLFDHATDFEAWYEGIVLSLKINMNKDISWEIRPYKQCKNNVKVELLEGDEKIKIEKKIVSINSIIAEYGLLEKKFDAFVSSQKDYILSMYSTSFVFKFYYLRALIRKLGLERYFLRHEQLKSVLNYSNSESLRDIAIKVIDNYIHNK